MNKFDYESRCEPKKTNVEVILQHVIHVVSKFIHSVQFKCHVKFRKRTLRKIIWNTLNMVSNE